MRSGATAVLYAKVAGYMKEVLVDKGDKVETGQILAEIELPEVEQQFAAASADLVHKRRNLARIKELYSKGNTTQVAMYQAETDVAVAENNVGVLATSVSYKTVRAPFAGRVTARFVDPGALVTNSQTNITSAMPMMTLLGRQPGARLHLCAADGRARLCRLATAPWSAMPPIRSATRSGR